VNSRFDAGEILVSEAIEVNEETTPQELFSRTARVAAETMPRLIAKFSEFGSQPTIQREGNPVFCKYYSKWSWNEDELRIKWNSPLRKIHFHVLANTQESYEYAGPWFLFKGRRYILRKTRIHDRISTKSRGNNCLHCDTALFVVDADETSIFLGNKIDPDILELVQVQRDDRFRQFRRAYPATTLGARPGDVFCSMKEA
jgi:methionyl-tRNA formyltransferase